MALTPKQEQFCQEYLIDLNGTQAAIRAGYSAKTARQIADENLSKPDIKKRIGELQAKLSERTQITQEAVLNKYWDIVNADPNDLVELRRECCRFCHGKGHKYQWTEREYQREVEAIEKANEELPAKKHRPLPDASGGFGFSRKNEPHPECPECHGEGIETLHAKDTRKLKGPAKALFAGVKPTQAGIEIKTHDQLKALESVGKHLGMFVDRHEHTGKDGGPIEIAMSDAAIDARIAELEARVASAQA